MTEVCEKQGKRTSRRTQRDVIDADKAQRLRHLGPTKQTNTLGARCVRATTRQDTLERKVNAQSASCNTCGVEFLRELHLNLSCFIVIQMLALLDLRDEGRWTRRAETTQEEGVLVNTNNDECRLVNIMNGSTHPPTHTHTYEGRQVETAREHHIKKMKEQSTCKAENTMVIMLHRLGLRYMMLIHSAVLPIISSDLMLATVC